MSVAPIHYRIFPKSPAAHLFEVTCQVTDPDPAGQRFSLPNWIPGSYLIRDFAKHIVELTATSAGKTLAVVKINKNTWQCAPVSAEITLTYCVYAWDLSVRGAHLDTTHGFFNGTSVFLAVEGPSRQCRVEILPPEGEAYRSWQVATVLAENTAKRHGFGGYVAESYSDLIDMPVEMGNFTLLSFEAAGVPHEIAITGKHRADTARLIADVKRVCEHHIHFFGEAPFKRYLFLLTVLGEGHGGLEHKACSALHCARQELPLAHDARKTEDYCKLLGLFSHEYFHAWHVKRIRPAAFTPYDLNRECYTQLLWVFEGITSYYDDLALVRSGVITTQEYLQLLAQTMTRVFNTLGRFKQTLAESSFDAWIKLYQANENAPNALISYYTKGALVALALDLLIRERSHQQKSLDDIMRILWQRYGKTGVGVPENVFEAMTAEVVGESLQDFFQEALHSTRDFNFKALLANNGVELHTHAAAMSTTKADNTLTPVLGMSLAPNNHEALLMHVYEQGAAQHAGLSAGDVIIAVDGLKVAAANLEERIASYCVGDEISVHAFRRDELMIFTVILQPGTHQQYSLVVAESEQYLVRRQRWLHSNA